MRNFFSFLLEQLLDIQHISVNTKWLQNGITVVGGNGEGNKVNQLSSPWGIYVDHDQTIYVADYYNHRIVEWKSGATSGQIVAGGHGQGNRNDQLNSPRNVIVDKENDCLFISDYRNDRVVRWPRRNGTSGETIITNVSCSGLTMDNNGHLYVSDCQKHEVRRWKIGETNGTVVAGGHGQGNRLNQLNTPCYVFVDENHSVYVSDYRNHRVMKWIKGAKEGIIVAGSKDRGNDLTQLSNPYGVIVDQLGTIYVADQSNHRVIRWLKGATHGSVIVGGNGQGSEANQLNCPIDLAFDRQNNLYVVDCNNHRVQKYNIETNSEFIILENHF
jgi:sugar lactone lactonase YvrE